jgi:hypothetical protein
VEGEAYDSTGAGAVATNEEALIGGTPAASNYFRSTVGIGDACTAAKVGPRLFLTAAHCVSFGRPGRGQPVPEGFPQNDGVRDDYLPGQQVLINWGLNADDQYQDSFTIAKTTIHPSWWECPLCQDPILGTGAADIAVIQIVQDTPQIPQARVQLDPVATGTQVVKVGWGCEERTNIDPNTLELGRYKRADASVIGASAIRHDNSPITDAQVAAVDASYLITPGRDQNPAYASLCLGDSGGPLYLPNNGDPRVVGVNSNYTFRPNQDPGGVSWTDWHTRTSLGSTHRIGEWLRDLGVNTVGGVSACTCPKGCNAVQQASVPFTRNGLADTCYFFPNLGTSVNSHSMLQVNLNGQNITNRWVGRASYPARRNNGYYLYVNADKSWSSIQAAN